MYTVYTYKCMVLANPMHVCYEDGCWRQGGCRRCALQQMTHTSLYTQIACTHRISLLTWVPTALSCAHAIVLCTCNCPVHMQLSYAQAIVLCTCNCPVHMQLSYAHAIVLCTCNFPMHMQLSCAHAIVLCTCNCPVHMQSTHERVPPPP